LKGAPRGFKKPPRGDPKGPHKKNPKRRGKRLFSWFKFLPRVCKKLGGQGVPKKHGFRVGRGFFRGGGAAGGGGAAPWAGKSGLGGEGGRVADWCGGGGIPFGNFFGGQGIRFAGNGGA